MHPRYPEVNKIASIILAKPAATAKEIAQKLQFSQPRSIYYWLRKAGYSGLNAFRHAVLTGEYPVTTYPDGPTIRPSRVAEVPLTRAGGPSGDEYVVTTTEVTPNAFAVRVASDAYVPVFQRNDVLIVDPGVEVENGDLVVLRWNDEEDVYCRAYPGANPLYVHPASGRPVVPAEDAPGAPELMGKIVGMQRHY